MNNIHKVVPKSMSRNKGKKSNSVKVVYISTPMKVKTSASQFRKLVQELTGRDSDIARIMMESNDQEYGVAGKEEDSLFVENKQEEEKSPSDDSNNSECLSSENNIDGIFGFQQDEQSFVEEQLMFDLDFVFNSSEIDVLGSYDAL